MESGGGSSSKSPIATTTKVKSNSLPNSSTPHSEEKLYSSGHSDTEAISKNRDDGNNISSRGTSFLEEHKTKCEGPGIAESMLNESDLSMLEVIAGTEEIENWIDAKSWPNSLYTTPDSSPSRRSSHESTDTSAVAAEELPTQADNDFQEAIKHPDHESNTNEACGSPLQSLPVVLPSYEAEVLSKEFSGLSESFRSLYSSATDKLPSQLGFSGAKELSRAEDFAIRDKVSSPVDFPDSNEFSPPANLPASDQVSDSVDLAVPAEVPSLVVLSVPKKLYIAVDSPIRNEELRTGDLLRSSEVASAEDPNVPDSSFPREFTTLSSSVNPADLHSSEAFQNQPDFSSTGEFSDQADVSIPAVLTSSDESCRSVDLFDTDELSRPVYLPSSSESASTIHLFNGPMKEESSDHEINQLLPQLRRKLGLQFLMVNLGRMNSLKELSDDEDEETRLSLQNEEVQVYRMEKKPERIVIKQEELWFHRPEWTEHPQLLPMIRHKQQSVEHLKLVVDETNQYEDSNEAELFMMHHRIMRSKQAALDTLIDEVDMEEIFLTPIGFEDTDVVLERKFFIRWKVAQLYQKNKKEKVKTTIPLTGTKAFHRPIPASIRIWRRIKRFFYFTWCSRNNIVHDEEIIRQDSIEAFHNEIFANAIGLVDSDKASGTVKRLLFRRKNIYGKPISTDNLRSKSDNNKRLQLRK